MSDGPIAHIISGSSASTPSSDAPTARIVASNIPPSGDYRITEDGQTRDFEDGEIEQLD